MQFENVRVPIEFSLTKSTGSETPMEPVLTKPLYQVRTVVSVGSVGFKEPMDFEEKKDL